MHMHEIIERELTAFCADTGRDTRGLQILETGTIRQDTEEHRLGDGWSTLAFAQLVDPEHGGGVTSVDLDTSVAASVLARMGVADRVTLRQGYSVSLMASMLAAGQRYDVILLDSENDPQLILHEYMLAVNLLEARPGLILVDDVIPGSATVRKGEQLIQWLIAGDQRYRITTRTGGTVRSGVLSAVLR